MTRRHPLHRHARIAWIAVMALFASLALSACGGGGAGSARIDPGLGVPVLVQRFAGDRPTRLAVSPDGSGWSPDGRTRNVCAFSQPHWRR